MKANFRQRLRAHLNAARPPTAKVNIYAQLSQTRSVIHYAMKQAQKELERFGYFLAITKDTGSLISAKIFPPSTERDFQATKGQLATEEGYPMNFEVYGDDERGISVYSHHVHGRGKDVARFSHKLKEIEDGVYQELENQIKAGIDFLKRPRAQ